MTNHTPSVAAADSALGGENLLRSLAETVTVDGTDLLATREKAVPWLRAAGLLPDDAVLSGSEHGALLRLRDALRDVLAARASVPPDPDAAARLTRALADGRLVVTVAAGRRSRRSPVPPAPATPTSSRPSRSPSRRPGYPARGRPWSGPAARECLRAGSRFTAEVASTSVGAK